MAKITAPITVEKVSTTIGRASLDVGTLCSAGSEYINKWSKHKPIRYEGADPLTDTEFAHSNYGFNLSSLSNNSAEYAFENRTSDWEYLAPTTGNWFRLTDFNGYNPDAVRPYNVSITAQRGELNAHNGYVHVFASLNDSANAEISLSDLGIFDESSVGVHWAVLYKYEGNEHLQIVGYNPESLTYDSYLYDIEDELSIDIEIPNITGSKEVEVCVVLLSAGQKIYNLPEAYATLEVENQTSDRYWGTTTTIDTYYSGAQASNYVYSKITINNTGDTSREIEWTYFLNIYNDSDCTDLYTVIEYSGTGSLTSGGYLIILPGTSESGGYGKSPVYEYGAPPEVGAVTYELRLKIDNSTTNQPIYTGEIEYNNN